MGRQTVAFPFIGLQQPGRRSHFRVLIRVSGGALDRRSAVDLPPGRPYRHSCADSV